MDIVRSLNLPMDRACTHDDRASRRVFFAISAVVFAVSAAATILGCASMSDMGGMPMAGGWTMSMMWMRMPGQTWAGVAASFIGMWIVMMKAMMLPSLTPALWCFRQSIAADAAARAHKMHAENAAQMAQMAHTARGAHAAFTADTAHTSYKVRLGGLVLIAGLAYFFVWLVYGVTIFVSGVALAAAEIRMPALARVVPFASGMIVLAAGTHQWTAWKARHLGCCRHTPGCGEGLRADSATAWRHGVRLGVHCGACTLGLTAVLLVMGVMDLLTMGIVTLAMTAERLAPNGVRVARVIGTGLMVMGFVLIGRAVCAA